MKKISGWILAHVTLKYSKGKFMKRKSNRYIQTSTLTPVQDIRCKIREDIKKGTANVQSHPIYRPNSERPKRK